MYLHKSKVAQRQRIGFQPKGRRFDPFLCYSYFIFFLVILIKKCLGLIIYMNCTRTFVLTSIVKKVGEIYFQLANDFFFG